MKIPVIISSFIILFTIIASTSMAFADNTPQFSFKATGGQNPSFQMQAGNEPTVDTGTLTGLIIIGFIIAIISVVVIVIRSISKSKKSEFICGYCNYVTDVETNLYDHYESEHRENNAGQESNTNKSQEEKNLHYLGILKERLAKGEISKTEYDELKKEFE